MSNVECQMSNGEEGAAASVEGSLTEPPGRLSIGAQGLHTSNITMLTMNSGQDFHSRTKRIEHLTKRAAEVLGGDEQGREWMKKPNYGLGGHSPLDIARSEAGAERVWELFGRIERGASL